MLLAASAVESLDGILMLTAGTLQEYGLPTALRGKHDRSQTCWQGIKTAAVHVLVPNRCLALFSHVLTWARLCVQVRRIVFEASYLVLGLGDVYLGAPCAVPVNPMHRVVTTKMNPARTFTHEGTVGEAHLLM